MTQLLYDDLWHYSERFTRDKLQRSELLTMALVQGLKMGEKCTPSPMMSVMHFRSKEINKRSAFDCKEVGKNQIDAFTKDLVYAGRTTVKGEEGMTLSDTFFQSRATPLDYTITKDFLSCLSKQESAVFEDMSAGYTHKEICARNQKSQPLFLSPRKSVQEKAVAYL